jgi:GAF domain-containing protein
MKETVHIADLAAEQPYIERHPAAVTAVELGGIRTLLWVPMLKENELAGFIAIYHQVVRSFTDKQIALLQNFAAQAVIAIENTRLLNELRQRTDDLSEALEQQTATSEVLRVFHAMLENATRICEAKFGAMYFYEGESFRFITMHNAPPAWVESRVREPLFRAHPDTALGRIAFTKKIVQMADARTTRAYVERDPRAVASVELAGYRTVLGVPMLKEDELIGAMVIYRQEVQPFTNKQIALVQNFANQAVIAIENTRLLNELRQRTDEGRSRLRDARRLINGNSVGWNFGFVLPKRANLIASLFLCSLQVVLKPRRAAALLRFSRLAD